MPSTSARWCCLRPEPSKEKRGYSERRRRMYKWNAVPRQPEGSRDGHPESSKYSPSRRGVSQLSCGQTITVRNFPLLGSGPILSRMWPKKSDTAAVSVGRVPSGACFGEPVEEFDPRPVRNNIGDAQPWFVL